MSATFNFLNSIMISLRWIAIFILIFPLENILAQTFEDSISALEVQIAQLERHQLDKKLVLNQQVYDLSILNNDQLLQAQKLYDIAQIYREQTLYNIAKDYFTKSLKLFKTIGEEDRGGWLWSERGYNSLLNSEFDSALSDYNRALDFFESKNDSIGIVSIYHNICAFFLSYSQRKNNATSLQDTSLREAKKYFEAVGPYLKGVSPQIQANSLSLKGRLLRSEKKFEEALASFDECIQVFNSLGNSHRRVNTEISLGAHYLYWGDFLSENFQSSEAKQKYRKAKPYFINGLVFHKKGNNQQGIIDSYINLGAMYKRLGEYDSAIFVLQKARRIANDFGVRGDQAHISRLLFEVYETMNTPDSALHYFKAYKKIQEEIFNKNSEQAKQFAEVHLEKKMIENEKLLAEQESRKRGVQLRLTFIIGMLASLMLSGIGYYYFQRNRTQKSLLAQQKKISSQLLVDLMHEHEIENLNARLKGQENERERIARALHDQIGGTLAAVKFSVMSIKKWLVPGHEEQFIQSCQLLEQACEETRELSHDMMALSVKKFGLEISIRELCKTLNESGKLNIHFSSNYQEPFQLTSEAESHVYRIVQELIQNIIKHAETTEAFLQIISQGPNLILIIEDHGKGFDPQNPSKDGGLGLENIRDRLSQLNGDMEIDSSLGRGTTTIIEIPI